MFSMLSWRQRLAAITAFLLAIIAYSLQSTNSLSQETGYLLVLWKCLIGVIGFLSLAIATIFIHLFWLNPAPSHSWKSLFWHYLEYHLFPLVGAIVFWRISHMTKNPRKVQEKFLLRILEQHRDTIYGQKFNLASIISVAEFTKKHPVTTYEHYEEYSKRVIEGEKNVFFKEEVLQISLSSGTTGGPIKVLPTNRSFISASTLALVAYLTQRQVQIPCSGRVLSLRHMPILRVLPGGVLAPITYLLAYKPHYVTPRPAFDINDQAPTYYVHALFGLADKDVMFIEALVSGLAYCFFINLEKDWVDLCDDLEQGTISRNHGIPEDVRIILETELKPNSARARQLRAEFKRGFVGIAKRVWPNLRAIGMLWTGGFTPQAKLLIEYYLCGVQVIGYAHVATEGMFGFLLSKDPKDIRYTLLPMTGFFEFIEECDLEEKQPPTKLMDKVEKGKSYELVVTNNQGLYRYRTNDVVKVVDFYNRCPTYEFQYRVGQLLNLYFERTPEHLFYQALSETIAKLEGVQLINYTTSESFVLERTLGKFGGRELRYVLFVELMKNGKTVQLDDQHIHQLDASLGELLPVYRGHRGKETIGRIQVIHIRSGGFQFLTRYMTKDTHNPQFKMPRVLRREDCLRFLLDFKLI